MGYSRREIAYRNWLIRVSILLFISLIANAYLYAEHYGTMPEGGWEGQIADLQNQISALQNKINRLTASRLITRLGSTDQRPYPTTTYVHIIGSVWNVGTTPAYNCTLHVILYRGHTYVVEDTYIRLGTIKGEAFADVDTKIHYEGSELTSWSITPEWE